jgi:hypothetical protein
MMMPWSRGANDSVRSSRVPTRRASWRSCSVASLWHTTPHITCILRPKPSPRSSSRCANLQAVDRHCGVFCCSHLSMFLQGRLRIAPALLPDRSSFKRSSFKLLWNVCNICAALSNCTAGNLLGRCLHSDANPSSSSTWGSRCSLMSRTGGTSRS